MAHTADVPDVIRAVLTEAMASDPSLAVVCEVPPDGLPADRVTVVPISDRGALGLAVGMAIAGRRVVAELSSASRLHAVLEVLAEAGRLAEGDEFAVPLLVRVPDGPLTDPSGASVAAATELPGIRVICPSTPALAAGLTRWALQAPGPVVLLEPVALSGFRGDVGDGQPVPPEAGLVRRGTHATIASWGAGIGAAIRAAEALARDGIDADVVDLVSLAPLDRVALGERVRSTGRLVVAHSGNPALAARVRQVALDEAFLYLEAPLAEARAGHGPIADAVRRAVNY